MIVSNTSPIANLVIIGQLHLLKSLYHEIVIPSAVREELAAEYTVWDEVKAEEWIRTQPVQNTALVEALLRRLHPGESEAIVLALERRAELLLLDEHHGRETALSFRLKTLGVLGILLQAKSLGLLHMVRPVVDELIGRAGFWVSRELYERVLVEAREQ